MYLLYEIISVSRPTRKPHNSRISRKSLIKLKKDSLPNKKSPKNTARKTSGSSSQNRITKEKASSYRTTGRIFKVS